MNYTILLVSHFIHNSLHNSFLHIFYITFKVRKLQLQILLTEKYPGLKPRNNHLNNFKYLRTTQPKSVISYFVIIYELQLQILLMEK